MPTPIPLCTISGNPTPVDVSANSVISGALASTAGANFFAVSCVQTDETTTPAAVNATLTIDQIHKTFQFTSTGAATSMIFMSTVGIGPSSALGSGRDINNVIVPAFTTTFEVHVKTAQGLRVLATNETTEGSVAGWIAKINAAIRAIATGTIAVAGSGLLHATGGSIDANAYRGTPGQALFTDVVGNADTAWKTITGDVSASTTQIGKFTVTGIQNVAVPAPSGANTFLNFTGTVLQWAPATATSALTAFGADLVNSTATNQWVSAISGSGGAGAVVPVHTVGFQFDKTQATPTISQAAQTTDVATNNLVLAPQPPWASAANNKTPGSVIVSLASPVAGGANAGLYLAEGGSQLALLANNSAASIVGLWLGPTSVVSPTSANAVLYATEVTGSVQISALNLGSNRDLLLNSGTGGNGRVILQSTGSGSVIAAPLATGSFRANLGATAITMLEAGQVSGRFFTALNQRAANGGLTSTQLPANSGDGITWVGYAQINPSAHPVAGAILYADATTKALWVYQEDGTNFQIQPAGGGGSVTWANDLAGSSSTHQWLNSISGSGGAGGAVPLASNAWLSVSLNSVIIKQGAANVINLTSGGDTWLSATAANRNVVLNAGANGQISFCGNGTVCAVVDTSLSAIIPATAFGFTLGWVLSPTAAANGQNLLLQPQASTNPNATPGSLFVELGAAAGSGSEAAVIIQRGGVTQMQLGTLVGSNGGGAAIYGNVTPSATNWAMRIDATRTWLNAPNNLILEVGGGTVISATASAISLNLPIGGNGGALRYTQTLIAVTGGTVTLQPSDYQSPIIVPTGTLSTNLTLSFPTANTWWIIDLSQLTLAGHSVQAQGPGGGNTSSLSSVTLVYVDFGHVLHLVAIV